MPISSQHPDYAINKLMWKKCRDVYNGSQMVKDAGDDYLPRLSGQDKKEYAAYRERALFYSIMSKSISALIGLATSTAPAITRGTDSDYLFIDKNNVQFLEVLCQVLLEKLITGRVGVLVDRFTGGKARPIIYPAESIINWMLDDNGNPLFVVLRETIITSNSNDKYEQTSTIRYRELALDSDGIYYQQLYNKDSQAIGDKIYIKNGNTFMKYIPFIVSGASGVGFMVSKSPSIDLAEVNLSHYRSSADLEHGRHFTALPTPVISGVDTATSLQIGSATAWVLPSEKASAKFLEFTGQGLKSLENALKEKSEQLANLSARLIDNSGNGSENPEVVRLRYASEGADLASVIGASERLLNIVYKIIVEMEKLSDQIDIQLNRQFFDARMSYVELEKLVSAYLSGGISQETFVFNLKRGEILEPNSSGQNEG